MAIIGGGFMGRLHLALARVGGASSIGVIDISEERLAQAKEFGATWTATPDNALEVGGKQDIIFVTAMAGVELAVEMADLAGSVVLYSAFADDLPATVGAQRAHHEETKIIGAFSQEAEDWRTAAGIIRSGIIAADLDALVTAKYGFDGVEEALQLVTSQPTFRVFVEPPPADA